MKIFFALSSNRNFNLTMSTKKSFSIAIFLSISLNNLELKIQHLLLMSSTPFFLVRSNIHGYCKLRTDERFRVNDNAIRTSIRLAFCTLNDSAFDQKMCCNWFLYFQKKIFVLIGKIGYFVFQLSSAFSFVNST